MKAISIKQPWVNLIARGQKTIETRSWRTNYRGDILIVASKSPAIPPFGVSVAIAEIADCRPMVKGDEQAACCDLFDGAYAWELRNVRLVEHVPIRGMPGLYEVDFRL